VGFGVIAAIVGRFVGRVFGAFVGRGSNRAASDVHKAVSSMNHSIINILILDAFIFVNL
jgi:hypothetical protein